MSITINVQTSSGVPNPDKSFSLKRRKSFFSKAAPVVKKPTSESTLEQYARDLINPDLKDCYQLDTEYDENENAENYGNKLKYRSRRLVHYMENAPQKYIDLGNRILVDWCRVQPLKQNIGDEPLTLVLLLRSPDEATTNVDEPSDYTDQYYLQMVEEERFKLEKVSDEIKCKKLVATCRMKSQKKYNQFPNGSSLVTFYEPGHLEGNPEYKRYGESIVFDFKQKKHWVLKLNIKTAFRHKLKYTAEGADEFKQFADDCNVWTQGRALFPYKDKILLFINDTRSKTQIWASTLTLLDNHEYQVDYEPVAVKFHSTVTQIKNLQSLQLITKDKLMVMVQALAEDPALDKIVNKDYYIPLYMHVREGDGKKQYFQLEQFTALHPQSVVHHEEKKGRIVAVNLPTGFNNCRVDFMKYTDWGIVNAEEHGNSGFSLNWTLTNKLTLWQQFCTLRYDPKLKHHEIKVGKVLDKGWGKSKYYYNHEEEKTQLHQENYLDTKLDPLTINPITKNLPVLNYQQLNNKNYLFLSYPFNMKAMKKIPCTIDDEISHQGNVVAVADLKTDEVGIYLNDPELGFILVDNYTSEEQVKAMFIDREGTMYFLIRSTDKEDKDDMLQYSIYECPKLDKKKKKVYEFSIPVEKQRWKTKLAYQQGRQAMGETLTAAEKKILDLNDDEGYTAMENVTLNWLRPTAHRGVFYAFSSYGDVYNITLNPTTSSASITKLTTINTKTHNVVMSPSNRYALLMNHPFKVNWYMPVRNEHYLVDLLTNTHIKINSQLKCFDRDFKVYKKYDDHHKFGCYFSQVPNKDMLFVYDDGDVYEVDLRMLNILDSVKDEFKWAKEYKLCTLNHYNENIDIVKYSKAKYLCHLGRVFEFEDNEGNERRLMMAILYIERQLTFFDYTSTNQVNWLTIDNYDMIFAQQRQEIMKSGKGRILLKLTESGIYDVDDFFLFKQPPHKAQYLNCVHNIERINLSKDEIFLTRKLINYQRNFIPTGVFAIQDILTKVNEADDDLIGEPMQIRALPPLNYLKLVAKQSRATKVTEFDKCVDQIEDKTVLLDMFVYLGRSNVFHHFTHRSFFLQSYYAQISEYTNKQFIYLDLRNRSPIDVALVREDTYALEWLIEVILSKQVNQVTRNLLNGRLSGILETGLDVKDLLQSQIILEDCLFDFLPSVANQQLQVMYIDNQYLQKVFMPNPKDPTKEKQFDGDYFLKNGLYTKHEHKKDNKLKQVQYKAVTIPECLSLEFMETIIKTDQVSLYTLPFLVPFKDVEWNKYQKSLAWDRRRHLLNIMLMIINVYFIHVNTDSETGCSDEQFCIYLEGGRQNDYLFLIKILILCIMLIDLLTEIREFVGLGVKRYFLNQNNYFDIGQIILYCVTVYYDQGETCDQLCKILYQPTLLIMFVVLMKHMRLESNLSFILEMLYMTFSEIIYFLITYVLLVVLYSGLFYIQGLEVIEGYEQMWIWGPVLGTLQESLGNFGTTVVYQYEEKSAINLVLQYEYSIFWISMVFVMLIIYTNFLIASVSDTYEKVTDMQDNTFSKVQLQYLATQMIMNEKKLKQRQSMMVKIPVGGKLNNVEWSGFVNEIKKHVSTEGNQIRKKQKEIQQQIKDGFRNLTRKLVKEMKTIHEDLLDVKIDVDAGNFHVQDILNTVKKDKPDEQPQDKKA